MEEYLVRTWRELSKEVHELGAPPTDPDGIALMRLMLQVQTPEKQRTLLDAYSKLNPKYRAVLRDLVDQLAHKRAAIALPYLPGLNRTDVTTPEARSGHFEPPSARRA